MSNNSAFTPLLSTVNIVAATSTANIALGNTAGDAVDVRLYNAGSAAVFVNFGGSSVVAALASSVPIPAGGVEVFSLGPGVTYIAAIVLSSTHTLYITPGMGV